VVASLSTLRQRSGSTPHDAVTVDPRLSSHQSVSLALNRQRPHSRQAANFARPRTANVASQGRAAHRSPYSLGKTSAQTPSIQTHQASRRDQIPIVLAASPLHHPPRFRALALFGRRPHQRVDSSIIPATENLHRKRHHTYTVSARYAEIFAFRNPSTRRSKSLGFLYGRTRRCHSIEKFGAILMTSAHAARASSNLPRWP
jgi:hypothetical protein